MCHSNKLPKPLLLVHFFETPHKRRVNTGYNTTTARRTMTMPVPPSVLPNTNGSIAIAPGAGIPDQGAVTIQNHRSYMPQIAIGAIIGIKLLTGREGPEQIIPKLPAELDTPVPKPSSKAGVDIENGPDKREKKKSQKGKTI